jgi:hypothetical protein
MKQQQWDVQTGLQWIKVFLTACSGTSFSKEKSLNNTLKQPKYVPINS